MDFKEALKLVIELAGSAVLNKKDCDTKELVNERARQIKAINTVQEQAFRSQEG